MSTDVLTNQNPTPNTKESNASCNLIMCNMSISFPNPRVECKRAEGVVKSTYEAKDKKIAVNVYLIREDYTAEIRSLASSIRTFFAENTISLGKSKMRGGTCKVIPASNFFRVQKFWNESRMEFDALAADFISRWESEIRPESEKALMKLAPTLSAAQSKWFTLSNDELATKFCYSFEKDPMAAPKAAMTMKGLTDQMKASLREELEEKQGLMAAEAHRELKDRLLDVVTKLRNKMNNYDPTSKGKMYDSIITNISKLVEPEGGNRSLIEDLCVGEGEELDEILELADDARSLCLYDVEMLKGEEGQSMREEVAKGANELINKIQGGNTAAEINKMMQL